MQKAVTGKCNSSAMPVHKLSVLQVDDSLASIYIPNFTGQTITGKSKKEKNNIAYKGQ